MRDLIITQEQMMNGSLCEQIRDLVKQHVDPSFQITQSEYETNTLR